VKTEEIKGVLREYKKTNEMWMNPNDIVECLNEIIKLRKALAVLKEMIKINGDNANTVQMHELIDEALKEVAK